MVVMTGRGERRILWGEVEDAAEYPANPVTKEPPGLEVENPCPA